MKPSQVSQVLLVLFRAGKPVLLTGQPGIGKTDLVTQASEAGQFDLIVSHPVVSDPTEYKGMPWVLQKNGSAQASFLPFDDLELLINADRPTIYFLDDLGQAPAAVQAAAMQLLLARRINRHKVSDSVVFAAATNRRQDKAAVQGILEPVKSRFVTIIEVESDPEDWSKWAIAHGLPFELTSFIHFRPELLNAFKPTADMVNTPCPRTVAHVGFLLGLQLPEATEFETYSGAAGQAFATELVSYLRIYRKLPDIDAIIANPAKGEVPSLSTKEGPATLYAVCGALASKANKKTFPKIITYAGRLPTEFSVMLIKDCIFKDKDLATVPAFGEWSVKHAGILL